MVFTRQKEKAGGNPESTARNHTGTNIREVRTPRRTVFTQEQNKSSIQQVLQYSQEEKGDELNYNVLGLNDSSKEDDMNQSYRSLALQFHPDRNQHSEVSEMTKIINEAKE